MGVKENSISAWYQVNFWKFFGKRRCLTGVLTQESEDNFKEMFLQVLQNEKDSDQTEQVFKYESREEKQSQD